MKYLTKNEQFKKISMKMKHVTNDVSEILGQRKFMNRFFEKKETNNNTNDYIEIIHDLNLDDTVGETLQRSMRIIKDKRSTELNKDISTIRVGFLNSQNKNIPIALHKSQSLKMSEMTDMMTKMLKKEFRSDGEGKCQEEIQTLKSQLKEMKLQMMSISDAICQLTKKCEDYNYDFVPLNAKNIFQFSRKYSYSKSRYRGVSRKLSLNQPKLNMITSRDKILIIERITQLKAENSKLKLASHDLQSQINKLEKELLDHYHSILYQGIEFRQEGFSEIIKLIWSIDQEVNRDFFPTYLDDKSIDYLFKFAKKSIEYNQLKKKMKKSREDHSKEVMDHQQNVLFSTSFSKENKMFKSVSEKLIHKLNDSNKENSMNLKNLQKIINKNDNFYHPKIRRILKEISQEENELNLFEKNIQIMKETEILRVTEEFLHNNYSKKYNVCIDTVMGALFGKSNKEKSLSLYYDTKKALEDKLKVCRFYYVLNDLKKKKLTNSNSLDLAHRLI